MSSTTAPLRKTSVSADGAAFAQPPPTKQTALPTKFIGVPDDLVRESILDPVLFAEHWLGVTLWETQKEILRSIAANRKTACRACHASSKTFTAAIATLWWLASNEEAVVITTAPTQRQVESVLWAEINNLAAKSLYPYPRCTLTKLSMGPKRYAFGFTTSVDSGGIDMGVKFQGYHSEKLLVILDEAPGVSGSIWGAIEGILSAGDVRLLAIGNPTISSGPFYDAFGVNREAWARITISAFNTPNLKGITLEQLLKMSQAELDYNPTPYLISRHWVKEMYLEWGINHPLWIARVLGEFPAQSPDSLFSLQWLEDAKTKPPQVIINKKLAKYKAGLDVAGPGEDETVLCIRCDETIVVFQTWTEPDPRGEIAAILVDFPKDQIELNIDVVGIGWYVARHFEDLGYTVSDMNVQGTDCDREKFVNEKAQNFWGLRMRLASGELRGLTDETAIAQLAGIRYKPNSRGQIEIESKDNARKRGVKSPDRAEGIMMAFAPSANHSLFDLWEEQAKNMVVEIPTLASTQKDLSGFTDKVKSAMGPREAIGGLGKVVTSPQQPDKCPNCDSPFLSKLLDGVSRCGRCGWRSPEKTD